MSNNVNMTHLIVHHTAGPRNQSWQAINEYHKKRWNFESSLGYYIGYHYLIGEDYIINARKPTEPGAHAYGWNYKSIGVSVTGNYNELRTLNDFQKRQLIILLRALQEEYRIPTEKIILHRDVAATACPGKYIDQAFIHSLLTNQNQSMEVKDNVLYQLVEKDSEGGFALGLGGVLIIDDLAKVLASWHVRNNGNTHNKIKTVKTKAEWDSVPHRNLKGEDN